MQKQKMEEQSCSCYHPGTSSWWLNELYNIKQERGRDKRVGQAECLMGLTILICLSSFRIFVIE